MARHLIVVFLFLLTFNTSYTQHTIQDGIQKITAALEKLYAFALDNYNSINIDCILGFAIADAMLADINATMALNGYEKYSVEKLLEESEKLLQKAEGVFREQLTSPFIQLINSSFWRRHITFTSNPYRIQLTNIPSFISTQAFLFNLVEARQDDASSDAYIGQLITSDGDICRDITRNYIELSKETHKRRIAYAATHRILFLQISRIRNCFESKRIESQIKKECSFIQSEMLRLEEMQLISFWADLYMEQITLCGMEGLKEFLQQSYLKRILDWQTDEGCFGSPTVKHERIKKDYGRVGRNGCLDHTTGVAASALSVFLRYFLQIIYANNERSI